MQVKETKEKYGKVYRELYDETGNKVKINDFVLYEWGHNEVERIGIFKGFKGAILLIGNILTDETIHVGASAVKGLWAVDTVRQKYKSK